MSGAQTGGGGRRPRRSGRADRPGPASPDPEPGDDESIEAETLAATAEPAAAGPERPSPDPAPAPPVGPGRAPVPPPSPPGGVHGDLTEDAVVRSRPDRPEGGWRGLLYTVTNGLVNPGIAPAELARRQLVRRIRRPLPGPHRIVVGSINGGVGRTTVTACLGLVLAEHRGDRVVAVDAGSHAGTLAERLTGEEEVTVRDLLDALDSLESLADVARYTSLVRRLQVLASEQDPAMSAALDRAEYERVCAVLSRFYDIVVTDAGGGLVQPAFAGALALADSLVIVGTPHADGARRADATLDRLSAHGHAEQVADAVLVLSCDRSTKHIDTDRVRRHFETRCRAVVEIPPDPHLATGGRIDLDRIAAPTKDAFLTLAALLSDRFAGTRQRVGAAAGATS